MGLKPTVAEKPTWKKTALKKSEGISQRQINEYCNCLNSKFDITTICRLDGETKPFAELKLLLITKSRKENIVESKFSIKNASDLRQKQYFDFNSSHNHFI